MIYNKKPNVKKPLYLIAIGMPDDTIYDENKFTYPEKISDAIRDLEEQGYTPMGEKVLDSESYPKVYLQLMKATSI